MSFLERVEELKYQSPNRKNFTLQFESVEREIKKKVAVNEFPYQDAANVQDLGNGILTLPINCFIGGTNYDQQADRFWKALQEPGAGVLDHPRWGSIDVIPVSYKQTESFVNGMGRAVFEIEFVEYKEEASSFPGSFFRTIQGFIDSVIGVIDFVLSAVDGVQRFIQNANRIIGSTLLQFNRISLRATNIVSIFQKQSKGPLQRIQETRNKINSEARRITRNMDKLVAEPAQMIREFTGLFRLASNAVNGILQKAQSYVNVITDLQNAFSSPTETWTPYEATIQGYMAISASIALAESTTVGEIKTRNEALKVIELLATESNRLKTISDQVSALGGEIDYRVLKEMFRIFAQSQRIVLDASLNLPTERVYKLEKDVTPIVWIYNLTGDVEELDAFISYNNLQDNENILMTAGTEVRYF